MYLNQPYDCHPVPENIFKTYGNASSHRNFYVNAYSGLIHNVLNCKEPKCHQLMKRKSVVLLHECGCPIRREQMFWPHNAEKLSVCIPSNTKPPNHVNHMAIRHVDY